MDFLGIFFLKIKKITIEEFRQYFSETFQSQKRGLFQYILKDLWATNEDFVKDIFWRTIRVERTFEILRIFFEGLSEPHMWIFWAYFLKDYWSHKRKFLKIFFRRTSWVTNLDFLRMVFKGSAKLQMGFSTPRISSDYHSHKWGFLRIFSQGILKHMRGFFEEIVWIKFFKFEIFTN